MFGKDFERENGKRDCDRCRNEKGAGIKSTTTSFLKAGKTQIFPLKKYSSLFAGSQPCLIVIDNKSDTKLLPKLFVNRILNPTLGVQTAGVLKELQIASMY